jgi:hypothetical protein
MTCILVDLHGAINLSAEEERSQETNASAEQSKADGDHSHVGQVDSHGQYTNHIHSAGQKPQTVKEQVDTCRGAVPERRPPPSVIFDAELQISQDHGNLSASGNQNQPDSQQESHNVVNLMQPKGGHDKGQFNADGPERKDSAHPAGDTRVHVKRDRGNDSSNLVDFGGNVKDFLLQSKVASYQDKGRTDTHPQDEELDNGEEGHRSCRSSKTQKNVQNHEHSHKASRKTNSRKDGVVLPIFSTHKLVEAGADVSGNLSTEDIQEDNSTQCLAFLHGVHQTKGGANKSKEEGRSNLRSSSRKDTQEKRRCLRWAENISMDQFPTGFVLCLCKNLNEGLEPNVQYYNIKCMHDTHPQVSAFHCTRQCLCAKCGP